MGPLSEAYRHLLEPASRTGAEVAAAPAQPGTFPYGTFAAELIARPAPETRSPSLQCPG